MDADITNAPAAAGYPGAEPADVSLGRIVSVTGAKAIVLLDGGRAAVGGKPNPDAHRPEIGTLFAIDTTNTTVLAIVSALSVPVPAQRDGESELWIAELGLVGELWKAAGGRPASFNRGVTVYPALGDRVRVARRQELELAFSGDKRHSVRVGCIRQDPSISAMVRVDDLLGKHFAILGTTGTGKSCTTALILRSILMKNPAAHIVLIDPHNEYASAFGEWAEVISHRNMQLPYWLLTFEELVEVLIGNPQERKAEVEILQELIPIAKARYGAGRAAAGRDQGLRRSLTDARFTVDTPVPYRISDLVQMIDDRMGKLENKKDLSPYRNLRARLEAISADPRYAFMFGSLTVYDGLVQILGRIFRVPVNDKPITILELAGLPTEIVNVVVSVLCRMTFDFVLWSEGQVPVTLVCEEAHRYVPANPSLGFEPCKRAIAKIAKEGRKYGVSLCIVTQRPAEIDPTILSQCNTVFALRMSNDRDQQIVEFGHLRHRLGHAGVPVRAGPARGDRLRRRRVAAGAHPLRRAAQGLHAEELRRPLQREMAEVRGRRGLPGEHRRSLAQRRDIRCRTTHGHVRRVGEPDGHAAIGIPDRRGAPRPPARTSSRAGRAPRLGSRRAASRAPSSRSTARCVPCASACSASVLPATLTRLRPSP